MKIRGYYGKNRLGFVNCQIICKDPPFALPIRLVVDTGSSGTVIADRDAGRLNLDYTKLEGPYNVLGIGGVNVRAYTLKGINIVFRDSESSYYVETLPEIKVLRHRAKTRKERISIRRIPSLLGLDILKKYKVRFNKNGVIIEK